MIVSSVSSVSPYSSATIPSLARPPASPPASPPPPGPSTLSVNDIVTLSAEAQKIVGGSR